MTALDPTAKDWLQQTFGQAVVFDELLSGHTYLRVGGPADAFVKPETLDDFMKLMQWLGRNGIPRLVIGGGTNLLVRDGGVRGVVVSIGKCLNHIHHAAQGLEDVLVTAGGGAKLAAVCRFAVAQGLVGLNFATGIPGTVGGGVAMNAGTRHGCLGDVVKALTVLTPENQRLQIERASLNFSYRALLWAADPAASPAGLPIIIEADFRLKRGDRQAVAAEADRLAVERRGSQPTHQPSAGCFFKNPPTGGPAGRLIDMAGLKGRQIGGAAVSAKHANFIVNKGTATARDILELKDLIQETVFKQFKVKLETEVKIVGVSS